MDSKLPRGTISRRTAALAVALTILATLFAGTLLVYAGRVGNWGATTFQLYNLDAQEAPVRVTFYDDDGNKALSFTDTLPARGTRFYEPELTHGLPTTFTGLLDVDSNQDVYGVVHHFANTADPTDGNLAHRMLATGALTTSIYLPYVDWSHDGWFTLILLQNPHGEAVTVGITYFDLLGNPVVQPQAIIPPHATRQEYPSVAPSFVGSAHVVASKPILVTVSRRHIGQRLAYNGQLWGSRVLRAPYIHSDYSCIVVQNTSAAQAADVQVTFRWPQEPHTEAITATIGPLTTHVFTSTWVGSQGQALVTGTQPLAAVVVTEQTGATNAARCYNVLQPDRASRCVIVPSVLNGYKGWHTTLWIQNLGPTPQEVHVLYTAAPTGTLAYTRTPTLEPYEVYPVPGDWLPPGFQHAAAVATGSDKIGVLVRHTNPLEPDGVMEYEGYAADACSVYQLHLPLAMRDW